MSRAQVPDVPLTKPERKRSFPFKFGMRSQEDSGVGAAIAVNARCDKNGHVKKTFGVELAKEILGVNKIIALYESEKSDGTIRALVIYKVSGFYVLRIIEEDKTVVSPLGAESALTGTITFTNTSATVTAVGGAFTTEIAVGDWIYSDSEEVSAGQVKSIESDNSLTLEDVYAGAGVSTAGKLESVHFLGEQFDFESIGAKVFVCNNNASTPLYSFDGTTLTVIANVSDAVFSIAADANRLAASFLNRTDFSGDDIVTSDDFQSGTGINKFGTYGSSIAFPKAVVSAGEGIVIFGKVGSEAHQVIPNAASDDVWSKTKSSVYVNKGLGVDRPSQVVSGSTFLYVANEKEVKEIDPVTGSESALTDIGAIEDFWSDVNKDSVVIGYDADKNYLVAMAQRYGQNDTAVCFDLGQKERPCWYSDKQYNSCLGTIGGVLHGGSSRDGKIQSLFTGNTDLGNSTQRFLYRIEKNSYGGAVFLKTFRKFAVYAKLHPRSPGMTARVFIDDDVTPVFEKTVTTTNAVGSTGSAVAEYGKYIFGMGASIDEEINNSIRLNQKNVRFNRVSIEIEETSAREFILKDVAVEIKSRGRFVRKFRSKDL